MKTLLLVSVFILCGCQTIVSISQTDMEVKKGHQILVSDSEFGLLNLLAPTYLSVQEKLAKKCLGGKVTGVETMLLKREFVLFQIYDLKAQASCQDAVASNPGTSTIRAYFSNPM